MRRPDQMAARRGLLRPLFDPSVAVAVVDPLDNLPTPFDAELAGLSPRAVDKRRREFAAGRAAAHQAMRDLGLPPQAIAVGKNRAPVWPPELVGSISHTQGCAMAAVAQIGAFVGLGLDVEEDTPLKPDLWKAICSPAEQNWMRQQSDPGQMGKLIFSAKEAAYKCQYAVSGRFYGFDGMELEIDLEAGRFLATFTGDQPPFQTDDAIAGRFAIGAGVIMTAAQLPITADPRKRSQ